MNVSINGGFLLSILAGSYMPETVDAESNTWRIIVCFPLFFQIIQILMLSFVYQEDTLKFLVQNH